MSELKHYGIPRKSGRYPWGSGENPYQSERSLLGYYNAMRKDGFSEVDVARSLGLSTTTLRAKTRIAREEKRRADIAMALRLKDKGYSNVAAAKRMGIPESTFRNLIDPAMKRKADATIKTAEMLKESFKKHKYIDVGKGVENHLGITKERLSTAIAILKEEGYDIHTIMVTQMGTGKSTRLKVLVQPGTEFRELYENRHEIGIIRDQKSVDRGMSFPERQPIQNVNSNRIQIRYGEEGGAEKDGLIEIRRGVKDLDMGKSQYSQVRVAVDGTHYLKGMAIYSDDMPEGVDIVYNVTKPKSTPAHEVFKKQTGDELNPFGASIKEGGRRGALNIVNEEGDWSNWSRNLSSQMLSKQRTELIKKQLDITANRELKELDEIKSLTNPAIKQRLLQEYADNADAAAVHLKAAALPRQSTAVLLPYNDIPDNEIYAPNYRNGEKVALIRHPHGGIFEIPVLTVNNKHKAPQNNIGNARDAVGININVANRLSGADFDGDTVVVIPTNGKTIKTSSPLKGLQNFDPISAYPAYKGMKPMNNETKQYQMGIVSNLITDMTIKGANESEIARAVRHSMVVIDAEKHKLDYKKSYNDNNIRDLQLKYQDRAGGGSSTLVSRASSQQRVPERKQMVRINPKTGENIYTETGASYVDKSGKTIYRTQKSTRMAETKDAHTLSSGTKVEALYADYANQMKSLANQARKEMVETKSLKYSPTAKKTYEKEVNSLNAKLNVALKNAPIERQAQVLANYTYSERIAANPNLDKDDKKKIRNQSLTEARLRTGAKKQAIEITDREWEAIQAGAISHTRLSEILNNANTERVRKLATPRSETGITAAQESRIKAMVANGYTQADIADALGVSTTTVSDIING